MLARNWTIKAEALWVDLNSVAHAGGTGPGGGPFNGGHMDVNFVVFRGGVNYKF
jgi:opacity protein-like surface antigen